MNTHRSSMKNITFNDLGWSIGKTGIRYGDGDHSTIVSPAFSVYMRKVFQVDDLTNVENVILHADYDDGFIAYINGIEIARANMSGSGINPSFNQIPDNAKEAEMYQGGLPQTFLVESLDGILQEGTNVLSIQVYNYGINSSDLTIIPFLFESAEAQNQIVTIWRNIAEYYSNENIIVGYDLMNEPIVHYFDGDELDQELNWNRSIKE